jgi:hypothetical protein
MDRLQRDWICRDLEKKIVFLVGPRQVGKTWLARNIMASFTEPVYFSYDNREDRSIIGGAGWREKTDLVVLDEIHKMPEWKNVLKGLWDVKPPHRQYLVTGSARLDIHRYGGDSLAGRFLAERLLPFTPAELKKTAYEGDLDRLMERGGFPEPFLHESKQEADRWRLQYLDGILREDVYDFAKIPDLRALRLVLTLLQERVGAPVSYTSIAEDSSLSPNTVKSYISLFEALMIVFTVTPHSKNIARSLLKEPKIYFFDTALVKGDEGRRFENLCALSLYKHVCALRDYEGRDVRLHALRTKEGEEVDFCLVENDDPITFIETKLSDPAPSKTLVKFHRKYGVHSIQLVKELRTSHRANGVDIIRAEEYLKGLKA